MPWAGPQGQYITELERERFVESARSHPPELLIHLSGRYPEETNYTQISIHAILRLLLSVSIITAKKKINKRRRKLGLDWSF